MDKEQLKKIFSANLRAMIERSGKEQKTIASDLGINAPTFNQWVTGVALPAAYKIQMIAEYLGCTTEYLLGEKDSHIAVTLNDNEYHFLTQYRDADESTKEMVRRILLYQEKAPNIKEDHHE